MQTDYGFPYITYTMAIHSITTDLFSIKQNQILVAAGYPKGSAYEAVDISKKDANTAQMLKSFGDISYVVEMPGAVTETNVGQKTGPATVTFLLSDAYGKDGLVLVKSQELNVGYIVIGALIIVLAAFALSFLKKKPEEQASPEPKRKKR
jgi:hypothetical protein